MTEEERQIAFEQWVSDHRPLLHRTVRAFARPADADDLMQELLLSLWKALPAFRSESRVSTFVYRVVHNAALTWTRRHGRGKSESIAEPDQVEARPNSSHSTDEALLELLYAQIHQLTPIDRSLMLLSLDDLSYEEIGSIHGMSANAIGVRLHRLRKQLVKDLQESIDDI